MGLSNNGRDLVARSVGGNTFLGATGTGANVTYSATAMTDTGASFTASTGGPPENGGMVGCVIISGNVYGTIQRNTSTVATVDHWHNATNPETVGTTPSNNATYLIVPAGFPCFWMGISVATRAFNAADAFLSNDGSTISEIWNSGGGLKRSLAAWSHTNGTATYQIAKTFTANGSDSLPVAVAKVGIFQHQVTAAPTTTTSGMMLFNTNLSASATLSASGDNVAITDTVTIS